MARNLLAVADLAIVEGGCYCEGTIAVGIVGIAIALPVIAHDLKIFTSDERSSETRVDAEGSLLHTLIVRLR
jgi:hypothetical protein